MKAENRDVNKLEQLIQLIRKLRAPDGCPWDQKQRKEDLGKYILEEAYEVMDSLDKADPEDLKEELGDLLFQILFLTEICAESGLFSLSDVMDEVKEKMIRRHPHVFGDWKVNSVQDVKDNWQRIKAQERNKKKNEENIFSSIPRSMPALKRAQKITSAAATFGFDWENTQGVLEKFQEELREFDEAFKTENKNNIEDELGDMLFTIVNLSRFCAIDAETALSKTTDKFLRRFAYVTEKLAAVGLTPAEATPVQMNALWDESKSKD
ncbi:MAG TPA: nucleoside triphosphate pyrophosphohydrolase [Smithella sp.]|nr:nucleoside triphosphate pyrophosphohydrolase [Smithella sp.]MDM7988560.1 nucleoside triphosphate pyrophosphohydrolase [Smithella sp.]HNY51215.1 nucleoside triphosphate pyrophosphohydrolase [Smithella sp.]HOG91409.1 nucleoside triphosphate pyrophosphohydrolase [Smithella sp.]HOU52076.1 nucleoside triphosphate pyrophosphohydrolase [Smithella sp.]